MGAADLEGQTFETKTSWNKLNHSLDEYKEQAKSFLRTSFHSDR